MHKIRLFSPHQRLSVILLSLTILLIPNIARGQNQVGINHNNNELLPSKLGEDWRAVYPPNTLNPDQWNVLFNSDVYAEYGLQRLLSQIYSDGKAKATVEVFEMRFPSGAYGLFTFNRESLSPNRAEFHHGRYLISITVGQNGKTINSSSSRLQPLIDELKKNLTGEPGEIPFLPSHLPEQNKIAGSEKYLVGPAALSRLEGFSDLKDVINFDGGVEAISANYHHGRGKMGLIIIEYQTPQSATYGMTRASTYFNSLDQDKKEKRILKRIGNYIVMATNVSAPAEADQIVSQIKYNPKVYWEGRKLSDLPIQFRPPDPAAIEEAKNTIRVLVRSFYWVGIMLTTSLLLGLIAGGTYFYWRRYRRRKLGLDELFGDAGETLRLNLDNFLPEGRGSSIKRIGDGKR